MEETSLLDLPEGMQMKQIQITENVLLIEVVATSPTACCPLCTEPSSSIHCHYRRTLREALCAGRRVQLLLSVRKFSCRNPYCAFPEAQKRRKKQSSFYPFAAYVLKRW